MLPLRSTDSTFSLQSAPSVYVAILFFLFINLLHDAWLQSVADYLQQVAYSFEASEDRNPLHKQIETLLQSEEIRNEI